MYKRVRIGVVAVSLSVLALVVAGAALDQKATREAPYKQLAVYTEVLSRIKSDYVEEPNLGTVTLGAINGLLESVDPFASYLNAKQYQEYLKHRDTPRAGVGLTLSRRFGYLGVVTALSGSPAAQAGLTTGDMIEAINGVSTRDMPLAYADLLLHGAAGSTVEISVLTVRQPEPRKIPLTRAPIRYPPVTHSLLTGQVGYIRAESLLPGGATQVAAALESLHKQNAQGIVLDLRRCSAGTPEDGLALANLFVKEGLLAYLQGQRVARRNFQADPSRAVSSVPLVVITNRGTAAGAEIAAASLLDRQRAEVVGERTYGDAALRQAVTMEDGSAIILAVAKYYTPSGKAIQDTGVTPTVALMEAEPVAETEEETPPEAPGVRPGEDRLLEKALEMLREKIRKAAG